MAGLFFSRTIKSDAYVYIVHSSNNAKENFIVCENTKYLKKRHDGKQKAL